MGIDAAPSEVRVSHHRDGFPQYDVGHLHRIDRIDALLREAAPNVLVTGSAHRGLGIPACIRQGRAAARLLAARLLA
jgi:oxygen-dependent protoporphyrinogen oxidase